MNNLHVPIIRLEVQDIKHTMIAALTEHAAKVDAGIRKAVENYCTDENINNVVTTAAREAIDCAVKEEVRNYFSRYNNAGRAAIREAVIQFLDQHYPASGQIDKA